MFTSILIRFLNYFFLLFLLDCIFEANHFISIKLKVHIVWSVTLVLYFILLILYILFLSRVGLLLVNYFPFLVHLIWKWKSGVPKLWSIWWTLSYIQYIWLKIFTSLIYNNSILLINTLVLVVQCLPYFEFRWILFHFLIIKFLSVYLFLWFFDFVAILEYHEWLL